eukprot:31366-Pelagococcus_subviridis.AAC.19
MSGWSSKAIGVHHGDGIVWGAVYRTRLALLPRRATLRILGRLNLNGRAHDERATREIGCVAGDDPRRRGRDARGHRLGRGEIPRGPRPGAGAAEQDPRRRARRGASSVVVQPRSRFLFLACDALDGGSRRRGRGRRRVGASRRRSESPAVAEAHLARGLRRARRRRHRRFGGGGGGGVPPRRRHRASRAPRAIKRRDLREIARAVRRERVVRGLPWRRRRRGRGRGRGRGGGIVVLLVVLFVVVVHLVVVVVVGVVVVVVFIVRLPPREVRELRARVVSRPAAAAAVVVVDVVVDA